ncbi:MAG: UbiX family flavin prenyltransferase [Rickettsiaceae bacterium]|nr:MAG: UbiX family flavin prenyltransferase [Rickettsiaceae bacterium]
MSNKKIIVAITGATGAIYGIRLLMILKKLNIETHLIISKAALLVIPEETNYSINEVKASASYHYNCNDISAALASGSYRVDGMIISPCSMNSTANIAHGIENNLISRAASVMLKEKRMLVLMCRETPLHAAHLENMLKLTSLGAVIAPPMPGYYNNPQTLDDIINHSVTRILDLFDIDTGLIKRWQGLQNNYNAKI